MNLRHLLRRGGVLPPVVAALAASCLLGWNLGAHYLWQDEAATAVLAERMMRFGKPLGFDGRNLITMDSFDPAESESIRERTGDPDAAIRFYVERGDFRHDTTWIGQPWGQFILAGVSLRLLGHGTVQARLPFVATAVLSVVLLYLLVRRRFRDPLMAAISVGLLLANVFWVLHARQCRYYAPSTLFLLLTLIAYLRWQDLRPWGATLFVAAAWCFFQQDYGTFWPVLAVLGVDAAVAARRNWPRVARVFGALLATITPWIWYYQLFGRLKETSFPWSERFLGTLFNLNQFQLPLVLVPILAWLLWRARDDQRHGETRLVLLCLAIPLSLLIWVPLVTPFPFHRYLVAATPLTALLLAFVIVRIAALAVGRRGPGTVVVASCAAVVVALCPVLSNAVSVFIPAAQRTDRLGTVLRAEVVPFLLEIGDREPADPNKIVIEALRSRLRPGDEILVTYEDAPFMFYTDQRIRGGIPSFRVEDRSAPPRFAVVRLTVPFLHWEVFEREIGRYRWRQLAISAPAIAFGNSPDPHHRFFPAPEDAPYEDVIVLERRPDGRRVRLTRETH